ncbi:MAG TPA: MauE/DoxX family redox-associated membrane protein [Thermodesulfobacteriota bacterium]|nr:MauE/DoxX family redox-associated membrane protein [Thermodesulfobacteriota bacterium]
MTPRLLYWACRLFLGGIFVYAGITKLANPLQFSAAMEGYRILSPEGVIWFTGIIPWLEIILGMGLFCGLWVRCFAASAGLLLFLFLLIMGATYLRGIEADCGCFGVGEKISALTLIRDTLFILPAVYLSLRSGNRPR